MKDPIFTPLQAESNQDLCFPQISQRTVPAGFECPHEQVHHSWVIGNPSSVKLKEGGKKKPQRRKITEENSVLIITHPFLRRITFFQPILKQNNYAETLAIRHVLFSYESLGIKKSFVFFKSRSKSAFRIDAFLLCLDHKI